MSEPRRSFASDNNAGIHPQVLEAIARANVGHAIAYGEDAFTERATALFQGLLGDQARIYPVFNGTGANVLALRSLTDSHHAILCSEHAHIHQDECGAPEKFTGCKLIPVPSADGKIRTTDLERHLGALGNTHHVQPKIISITQTTELGTLYAIDEVRALADFAHAHGMYLHMDGARIANAVASLGVPLKTLTTDAGVDVLSFGGTKNGILLGEAVAFLNPGRLPAGRIDEVRYLRKQSMQLASKMRFLSAQFEALFTEGLWLKNATHANSMARLLADEVARIPALSITQQVQANALFVAVPKDLIQKLQQQFHFYVWDERRSVVRWMTSWDTTEEDVRAFVSAMRMILD